MKIEKYLSGTKTVLELWKAVDDFDLKYDKWFVTTDDRELAEQYLTEYKELEAEIIESDEFYLFPKLSVCGSMTRTLHTISEEMS